jgi:Arc/MetJ family transcription regulator
MCIYSLFYTHELGMRTNIEIDDDLIGKAMSLSGLTTKRETVEEALRLLVRLKSQEAIRNYRGKLLWEGDLEAMRADHDPGR